MATSPELKDLIMNALAGGAAFQIPAMYLRLHKGAPGASGTGNLASNATRMITTWSPSSGGMIALAAPLVWTATHSEVISHWSLWNHLTAGVWLHSDAFHAAKSVTAGDEIYVPAGSITLHM